MSRVAPRPVRQKEPPFVSDDLRKFANGKECQYKGPTCNGDTKTTCLRHNRFDAGAGMSEKPDDFWGFHACENCERWHEKNPNWRFILNAIRRTQKAVYEHFGTLTP